MASKVIAQLIIQASAVFTRAAAQAYGQALQNAKKGGGTAVSSAAARARAGKMQPQEALDILNIQRADMSEKTVEAAYQKFYQLNDPAKGGSFYLQSKFYRAKEALDYEMNPDKPDEEDVVADAGAEDSDKGSTSPEERRQARKDARRNREQDS
eukprot:GSChrysophyteH1.ASY1.ANO1.3014.1 assembled CDS